MKKTVIITAARLGMGAETARYLAAQGYRVALFARSAEIHTLAAELDGLAVQGDLTNKEDLCALVSTVMATFGRIDGLVINSGHPAKGELLDISDEDWYYGFNLLVLNVVRLCRLIVPIMVAQKSGAIVNISSFAAFEPNLIFPLSSAFRAALGSITKLLADRYAGDGIRVNAVLPGYIDSYPLAHELVETIPMQRQGRMLEIAQVVAFLLSEHASYLTGQNIRVDGGITKHIG